MPKPEWREGKGSSGAPLTARYAALMVADAFPGDAVPTPAQLQERFGMSRASAYRWSSAFRLVRHGRAANDEGTGDGA
jgi:hypothetical protein